MVESGWSCDFGMEGRRLWFHMLSPYDPEVATKAVIEMSKFPLPNGRFKPQISDLRAIIVSLNNRTEKQQEALTEGKRGVATPEWVWVWSWSRFMRNPPEPRAFPQQEHYADPTKMMSKQEYEGLRNEWITLGSPKSANPLPSLP